jgi:hypothetical protein
MKVLHCLRLFCLVAVVMGGCLNLRDARRCSDPLADKNNCEPDPALDRTDGGEDRPRPSGLDAPGQSGGPVGGTGDSGSSLGTGGSDGNSPAGGPGCDPGLHRCSGVCVDNNQVIHCGTACEACPTVSGGQATCDGVKCGVSCPSGKKVCAALNSCIGMDEPCEGSCPEGKNPCNGLCVLATNKIACGPSCAVCPTPTNGRSECDGTTCLVMCDPGFHRCGDACVDDKQVATCGVSCTACPNPFGGSATCDGTNCGTACPSGTKLCLGACIGADKPCEGQCPPGKLNCNNSCQECCSPGDCPNRQSSCNGLKLTKPDSCVAGRCQGSIEDCRFVCTVNGCMGDCRPGQAPTCQGSSLQTCDSSGNSKSTTCELGCVAGGCCRAPTEAINGKCTTCGGMGQPCCKLAPSDCQGLTCQSGMCCNPNFKKSCSSNDGCQVGTYDCSGKCVTKPASDNTPCGGGGDPCMVCSAGACGPKKCGSNQTCSGGKCLSGVLGPCKTVNDCDRPSQDTSPRDCMFHCRINADSLCSTTPGHQNIYSCLDTAGDGCNTGEQGRCIPHTPPAP